MQMAKYVVCRPKTNSYVGDDCGWDNHKGQPSISVLIEDGATDTGLLNIDGHPLYRVDERTEAGFWPHRKRPYDA